MKRRFFSVILCLLLLVAAWLFFEFGKKSSAARRREVANMADAEAASAKAREAAEKKAKFLRDWRESQKMRHVGTNAADIYRQAFELFDALSDEEKKMLKNPRDEVDADAAAELFKKIQPILKLMKEAGAAEYCHWISGPIRFDTPVPYIGKAMDLGRLALWSAAYRFQTDPQGALDDLATQRQLGRTLPDNLIGVLVETAMNASATDFLNINARSLDANATAQLSEMLRDNSYPADLARAMQGEIGSVLAQADDMQQKSSDDVMKLFASLKSGGDSANADAQISQLRAMGYDDPSKVAQSLRDAAQLEQQLIPVLGASDAQFNAVFQQVMAQVNSNPFGKMLLPSLDSVHNRILGTQVQNAMLGVGLAIIQNGPGQIGAFTDPATGNVFTYTPTADGGFQLTSTFQMKGKPVTMTFPPKR